MSRLSLTTPCSVLSCAAAQTGNCANVGLTLNSACGQFTSAIQQNYQTILSTSCADLANTLAQPQYGTPSAAYAPLSAISLPPLLHPCPS
jgi:hypothetical protein